MTTLLRVEEIEAVGFVDSGANQLADVLIWKRSTEDEDMSDKPQDGGKLAHMLRAVGSLLKWSDDEVEAAVEEAVTKSTSEEGEMTEFNVAELPEEAQEHFRAMEERATTAESALEVSEAKVAELSKAEEPEEDDVLKGLPEEVVKRLEAAEERADRAEEIAKAERRERRLADFRKQAEDELDALPGEVDDKAELLEAIEGLDDEQTKALRTMLRSANEVAKSDKLMDEHGVGGGGEEDKAIAKISARAKELVEKGDIATFEQAFDHVMQTDTELAMEYKAERKNRR